MADNYQNNSSAFSLDNPSDMLWFRNVLRYFYAAQLLVVSSELSVASYWFYLKHDYLRAGIIGASAAVCAAYMGDLISRIVQYHRRDSHHPTIDRLIDYLPKDLEKAA
jgi:hypothetical protein